MIGSIIGGLLTSNSGKSARRMLSKEREKNEEWYNRRYNEVGTERSEAQAALTRMREAQAERSRAARGAEAVTGAGTERAAVEKAAQNNAMAQTIASINAQQEARKDAIEAQYQSRDADITAQELAIEQREQERKQEAISQAAGFLNNVTGDVINSFL